MVVSLSADHKVYATFPIIKSVETDAGLVVYGKATDGRVDADDQIVDPNWSGAALEKWLRAGGNVRVQHNPQLYPAGRGLSLEVDRDGDGGHWVKSLIVEPTAQNLVRQKVLRAYSIGITRPVIRRDTTGKARGGIVSGNESTEIAEVSLVDRPSNSGCGLTLAKGVDDGETPWSYGDFEVLLAQAMAKSHEDSKESEDSDDADGVEQPGDVEESATADEEPDEDDVHKSYRAARDAWLAREPLPDYGDLPTNGTAFLVKQAARAAWQRWDAEGDAEGYESYAAWSAKRDVRPEVGGGTDVDAMPAEDFIDSEGRRFPIHSPGDVSDAVSSYGRADPKIPLKNFRRRLTAIAHRKGPAFVAELPESWTGKNITTTVPLNTGLVPYNLATGTGGKNDMVVPDFVKTTTCPHCGAEQSGEAARRCDQCGRKLRRANKTVVVDLGKAAVHNWKHGWIWVGPGAAPDVHRHVAEHHQAMSEGRWKDAAAHLHAAATSASPVGPGTIGIDSAGFVHERLRRENPKLAAEREALHGRLVEHARTIASSAPSESGKMTAADRAFHEHAARAHEAASAGIWETAFHHQTDAMLGRPTSTPKEPKAPKALKVPKATGPGVDTFGGRSRASWLREAGMRGRKEQGLTIPRKTPAHEIARLIGEHDTQRAASQSYAIRHEGQTPGATGFMSGEPGTDERGYGRIPTREEYIQAAVDRFHASHKEALRNEGVGAGRPAGARETPAERKPGLLTHLETLPTRTAMRRDLEHRPFRDLISIAEHLGISHEGRSNTPLMLINAITANIAAARSKTTGVDMTKAIRRLLPPDVEPAGEHREPDGSAVEELEADAGLPTTPDAVSDNVPSAVKRKKGKGKGKGRPFPGAAPPFGSDNGEVEKSYAAWRMHDALCPAYSWATVAARYPSLTRPADAVTPAWFADAATKAVDPMRWELLRANAAELATGYGGVELQADARAELHKAFADMYPTAHPTPASITPGQYRRPYITARHAPLSAPANPPANIPPASHVIHPDDFQRPLITEGHQAEPPSDRGSNLETSTVASGASRTYYTNASREAARNAMAALHDHIQATFPDMCPLSTSKAVMPPDMGAVNRPTPTVVRDVARAPGEKAAKSGMRKVDVAELVKAAVVEHTAGLRSEYETKLALLQQELDELGAQPDPAQAPLRGVVRKAATEPEPVQRVSLVEKAQQDAAAQQAEYVSYLRGLASDRNPNLHQREQAQGVLERMLTS
jgi:hypothetical protein